MYNWSITQNIPSKLHLILYDIKQHTFYVAANQKYLNRHNVTLHLK